MIIFFSILVGILVLYLVVEFQIHIRKISSIPIRIHVNGTRGKSSVTRLIAGALREHGIRAVAKTTGTLPRVILATGKEYPVYRPARANVIEQLRIISLAASHHAQALVIECMALQPRLQALTEHHFVRSTHGVITNARPDHLDVMGPSEKDVALALMGTIPYGGQLFTAEGRYRDAFEAVCADRKSTLVVVEESDAEAVTDQDMAGFHYVEHKINVALVLKVCSALDIARDVALRGMWKAKQDPGAMSECFVDFFGRKILFINGFAANDPESSALIWKMAIENHPEFTRKIMVVNSRADRPERSKQLGEALIQWPRANHYVLMGTGVYLLLRTAVSSGMDPSLFVYAEGMTVSRIFEEIVEIVGDRALVMGFGNIGGLGLELVHYFQNRSDLQ